MAADVEQRVDPTTAIARDDDAFGAERAGERVARAGDLIGATRANPAREVKALEFLRVELRIGVKPARQRGVHQSSGWQAMIQLTQHGCLRATGLAGADASPCA